MSECVLEVVKDSSRFQQIIDYLYSEFYPRERLSFTAGLTRGTYFNLVGVITEYLKQGVSLVLTDPSNGDEIIGIAVNCIATEKDTFDYPDIIERGQRAVVAIIQQLENAFDPFDGTGKRRGLEMYYLGVKESYSKRGLARRLAEETLRVARENGLDFVHSTPSSPATIHLFEKMGFETKSEIKLVDFSLDGAPAFPLAKSDEFARYVVKFL